ncbi:MAG TPA: hypothetical protein VL426_02625 [Candidatus Binatia bacterium]|jgi:hypothetical protein|nr:hypothetical protein [Candidatus Binatia bacterium]
MSPSQLKIAIAATAVVVAGGGFVAYKQFAPAAPAAPKAAAVAPAAAPAPAPVAPAPAAAPAAKTEAQLTFMQKLQLEGKPYVCDFDFSKATIDKPAPSPEAQKAETDFYAALGAKDAKPIMTDPKFTAEMEAQMQGLAQKTTVKLYVKGPRIRTDATVFGSLSLITLLDSATGMADFGVKGSLQGMGAVMPAGCDFFSFNVDEMMAMAGKMQMKGQMTDPRLFQVASGTAYSCKPATFGDEMFATGKVCDGKAYACGEARKNGSLANDPELAKFCGS